MKIFGKVILEKWSMKCKDYCDLRHLPARTSQQVASSY